MKKKHLKTRDIYHAAYLVLRGAELENINIDKIDSHIIELEFSGKDINEINEEYQTKNAIINLRHFKEAIMFLRDVIAEKIEKKK